MLEGPRGLQSRAVGTQSVERGRDLLQRGAPQARVRICQAKEGWGVREGTAGQATLRPQAGWVAPSSGSTGVIWSGEDTSGFRYLLALWEPGHSFSRLQAMATLTCKGPGRTAQ